MSVAFPVSVMLRLVDQFSRPMGVAMTRVQAASKKMSSVGRRMSMAVTLPSSLLLGAMGRSALEFEQEFNELKASIELTEEQLESIRRAAMRFGRDTKFSLQEVLAAEKNLLRGGLGVEEMLKSLPNALNMAALSDLELEDTATAFIQALRIFNIETENSEEIADSFSIVAGKTSTTVGSLAEGLKMTAASAKLARNSLQETLAVLGLIGTGAARTGTMGGTAGGRSFQEFTFLSEEMIRRLGIAGVKWKDIRNEIGGINMVRVVEQLEQMNPDTLKALMEPMEQRAKAGISGLLSGVVTTELGDQLRGSSALRWLIAEQTKAHGIAGQRAERLMEGLPGKLLKLKAAFSLASIQGVNPFSSSLEKLVGYVNSLLEGFADLSPETRKLIVGGMALLAVAGPTLVLFGALAGAVGALGSTAGLAVMGVLSLAAAGTVLYKNWDKVREVLEDVGLISDLNPENAFKVWQVFRPSLHKPMADYLGLTKTADFVSGLFRNRVSTPFGPQVLSRRSEEINLKRQEKEDASAIRNWLLRNTEPQKVQIEFTGMPEWMRALGRSPGIDVGSRD